MNMTLHMPVPGKIEYILRAKGPYLHFTRIVKQAGVFLFLVFERQGVHLSYKIKQGFRWSSLRRPLLILRSFSMKRPNSYKGKHAINITYPWLSVLLFLHSVSQQLLLKSSSLIPFPSCLPQVSSS